MPRKGSRHVTVDDEKYRFMVSAEGPNQCRLRVTVEAFAYPGHVLIATYERAWLDPVGKPEIARLIRFAFTEGWSPKTMATMALGQSVVAKLYNLPFGLVSEWSKEAGFKPAG